MYVIRFVIVLARCAAVADAQFIYENRLDVTIEFFVLFDFLQGDFIVVLIRKQEVAEVEFLTMIEPELCGEVVFVAFEFDFVIVFIHVKD